MRLRTALRVAGVAALGLWLTACASEVGRTDSREVSEQRQIVAAIRLYYASNAAEENNACSAPIMDAVTRTQVVSDSDGLLVVDVSYAYANEINRSGRRCRGFGTRQFTLSNEAGRFRVVEMTGERRLGARWRIW